MTWLVKAVFTQAQIERLQLKDAYAWHQFTWRCFQKDTSAKRDFLTRVDATPTGARLYILSQREPVKPQGLEVDAWQVVVVDTAYLNQNNYLFALRANPIKQVATFDTNGRRRKNNKKVALYGKEEQKKWLIKHLKAAGVKLISPVGIASIQLNDFSCRASRVHQVGVDFTGYIKVIDKEKFIQTFTTGIGGAKAFGFGMLLIRPVSFDQENSNASS